MGCFQNHDKDMSCLALENVALICNFSEVLTPPLEVSQSKIDFFSAQPPSLETFSKIFSFLSSDVLSGCQH